MKRIVLALALVVSAFADSPQAYTNTSITSAATVKSAPGNVYGYSISNSGGSACYAELFNATPANVTLGTTAPTFVIPAPAGGGANLSFPPVPFGTAISIAAVTSPGGSSTCAVAATVLYL
jgi:hypothetical protein